MPYNPLALQRYYGRKAAISSLVAAGELTFEQGAAQLKAFAEELFRRRGEPVRIDPIMSYATRIRDVMREHIGLDPLTLDQRE